MATSTHDGTIFKEFVRTFAGTQMVLNFGFKECTCEHASLVLEVGDETVTVIAFDDETGKPVGEGEFPWSSVISVRMQRLEWDHTFAHATTNCTHTH
ncbi:MAG: hypothetical protein H7338_01760 [Candidatus Sericytochromatia bacterium]|nr:hypothetical protein [Candidatus Sericytochromatia bacterium]